MAAKAVHNVVKNKTINHPIHSQSLRVGASKHENAAQHLIAVKKLS